MGKEDLLTEEKLKKLLHYNPDTGVFTWRKRTGANNMGFNKKYADKEAGTISYSNEIKRRNIGITIDKKIQIYFAHRLAFLYMDGRWPKCIVTHINGKSLDNRWFNLKDVARRQTQKNIKLSKRNKSGHQGVHWNKSHSKWRVTIGRKYIGSFKDLDDAIDARRKAEKHGYRDSGGEYTFD